MHAIALDIGGAHIKGASSRGAALTRRFSLWKEPRRLAAELTPVIRSLGAADLLAVTMTGELSDCFPDRSAGVLQILDSVEEAARGVHGGSPPISVWTLEGALAGIEDARREPLRAAAANWLALATWVAGEHPKSRGVIVDIGSTTSDVVAFAGGEPLPLARTDAGRLRSGELVYSGVLRTPACAIANEVELRGALHPLAAELFAGALDVYLLLGEIDDAPDLTDTADGRPATREHARARLARMLCIDPPDFPDDDAVEVAAALERIQLEQLSRSIERVLAQTGVAPGVLVSSGSGEFLARKAFAGLGLGGEGVVSLEERLGRDASIAACAVALARLASRAGSP